MRGMCTAGFCTSTHLTQLYLRADIFSISATNGPAFLSRVSLLIDCLHSGRGRDPPGGRDAWKRSEFESATNPRPLVEAMSRELTNRLRSSPDPETESRSIVDELRSDGHELFSWDESTDFQT